MTGEELLQNAIFDCFIDFLNSEDAQKSLGPAARKMVVSDINQKIVRHIANKPKLGPGDIAALSYILGDDVSNDEWDDDMVQEYADNIQNFLYQYKESATNIDPSIDPNEFHRGPMAQDIEKVAPDCVKETNDGTKVVDGNRLALVNAGVIGELSRRLIELEDKVNGGTN